MVLNSTFTMAIWVRAVQGGIFSVSKNGVFLIAVYYETEHLILEYQGVQSFERFLVPHIQWSMVTLVAN